jgi:hypothetical protein
VALLYVLIRHVTSITIVETFFFENIYNRVNTNFSLIANFTIAFSNYLSLDPTIQ